MCLLWLSFWLCIFKFFIFYWYVFIWISVNLYIISYFVIFYIIFFINNCYNIFLIFYYWLWFNLDLTSVEPETQDLWFGPCQYQRRVWQHWKWMFWWAIDFYNDVNIQSQKSKWRLCKTIQRVTVVGFHKAYWKWAELTSPKFYQYHHNYNENDWLINNVNEEIIYIKYLRSRYLLMMRTPAMDQEHLCVAANKIPKECSGWANLRIS